MSPSSADAAPIPEPKITSGLASVLKSLTGSKSSKIPNHQAPALIPQHLNTANTLKNAIYGGPPNYEQLFEQLKVGNSLSDRLAAAEFLRHAVQDYPLSGVGCLSAKLLGAVLIVSIGYEHIQGREGSHSAEQPTRSSGCWL